MIIGVGTDLASVERFEQAVARQGERLLRRIFTDQEVAYARSRRRPAESLAARFAAKEATFKAIGYGWPEAGVRHHDVEVVRAGSGPPQLRLSGRVGEIARARGANRFHLSLTHSDDTAAAFVLLEAVGEVG